MSVLDKHKKLFDKRKQETLSLDEFLKKAKKDKSLYASPAERVLKAIGEPEIVDTSKDSRLSRIFGNRIIRRYATFKDFYGMEDVIDRIVSFFRHSAQGLEESRQILYLLGPVGSAKSSITERLQSLIEQEAIYVLTDADGNKSPINESPLGLFTKEDSKDLGIPERNLGKIPSPWTLKKIEEYEGDLSKFKVTKVFPSFLNQVANARVEAGDENTQDISTLTGKVNIRKIEHHNQDDPDCYSFSGGLCKGHQGLMEFVEMFKASLPILNPLLVATQEHHYQGTEAIGSMPFDGIIIAHSNESEWTDFKNNQKNEAFLDRIYIVEVPYCLRTNEEVLIYKKLISSSELADAPCAPKTLDLLAQFSVMTRLSPHKNSNTPAKMKVYNGENIKDKDTTAKSLQEYKDTASRDEGFFGLSTRLAYKILSEVYNFDPSEVAADPVHLFYVLEKTIRAERLSEDLELGYTNIVKKILVPQYVKSVGKDIQTAYLDSYDEYGQSLFDRYVLFADHWIQDSDYRDPDTGQMFDREALNQDLEKIEKPAEIANPKDFRNEIVNFCLRHRAKHQDKNPGWKSYEKLRRVIESNMFSKTKDLLPVISFSGHGSNDDKKKHESFVNNMKNLGYTEKQIKRVVEWHMRTSQSS